MLHFPGSNRQIFKLQNPDVILRNYVGFEILKMMLKVSGFISFRYQE